MNEDDEPRTWTWMRHRTGRLCLDVIGYNCRNIVLAFNEKKLVIGATGPTKNNKLKNRLDTSYIMRQLKSN